MTGDKRFVEVNEDLAKERLKCNFNITEVTNLLDGGPKNTAQRKRIEDIALSSKVLIDNIPEECMSIKERYENALRKSVAYTKLVSEEILELTGMEALRNSPVLRRTADAFFKEVSPFLLHLGMFVPTIMGQCTPEQQAHWLPRALGMQIIGTYAQTELGHGTFIKGLETTATYDPETEEFVLHSPTLTSLKWWAGGLGKTVNHCIVVAQLYTQGKCHGIHPFIVQIRDQDSHEPLPGIKVGEIGPKLGFNTADNGFLGFNHYRIPRMNMMMKNAQVLQDGTYVKVAHGKLTYGTMVFVRVMLVNEMSFNLAKACTISIRYSAVRRQSQKSPGEPESQILDYMAQQHKLFICIATSYALQLTSDWLWTAFNAVLREIKHGNIDSLPEFHALSSCLKAISTSDVSSLIEQCRHACGGHGYMMASGLPHLYAFVTATRTYEGDYTVLLLQTAKFLVKSWEQAEAGKQLTPTVAYLSESVSNPKIYWDSSPEGIVKSFQSLAAGKVKECVEIIRRRMKSGMSNEDAWEHTTILLVGAAEAHCRAVIADTYRKEIVRITATSSPNVKAVMEQLMLIYLHYWALVRIGDLLRYSTISEQDIVALQLKYEDLLLAIRPNVVGLVDAFDIRDEILHSALGSYDGRVYERLYEQALKTPLNAEPVNQSFHKYMKPLMQGKL